VFALLVAAGACGVGGAVAGSSLEIAELALLALAVALVAGLGLHQP